MQLLTQSLNHLENFINPELSADMACEELRMALKEVASITEVEQGGEDVDVEEVLDRLFKDFCIGK